MRAELLYCVPTGNNPTGRTMPDADRERLVSLCAEHRVRIVADDVYELLQWGRGASPPRPLRWHAQHLLRESRHGGDGRDHFIEDKVPCVCGYCCKSIYVEDGQIVRWEAKCQGSDPRCVQSPSPLLR